MWWPHRRRQRSWFGGKLEGRRKAWLRCNGSSSHLDADEVAIRSHPPRPLLGGLGQVGAGADADHRVVEIVFPGPVFEEGPHQIRKALFVRRSKAFQLVHRVHVLALASPDRSVQPAELFFYGSLIVGSRKENSVQCCTVAPHLQHVQDSGMAEALLPPCPA